MLRLLRLPLAAVVLLLLLLLPQATKMPQL
jgi:hypothetical protein